VIRKRNETITGTEIASGHVLTRTATVKGNETRERRRTAQATATVTEIASATRTAATGNEKRTEMENAVGVGGLPVWTMLP